MRLRPGPGRCQAHLPPDSPHAGPYHGRCDLQAGHKGLHELERGMDTVFFSIVVASYPAASDVPGRAVVLPLP